MLDGRQGRCSRAPVVPGDEHVVGVGLGDARRHGPHARLRDELHAHARPRVHLLQIVDQLRQVLDRIDVVVRRRRDQRHPGHGMPQPGDQRRHLVTGELAPFAGLRSLRHLDLELLGAHEIPCRHAEPSRRDLLDLVVRAVAVRQRSVGIRIFAALATVRPCAHAVHPDRERAVRLG